MQGTRETREKKRESLRPAGFCLGVTYYFPIYFLDIIRIKPVILIGVFTTGCSGFKPKPYVYKNEDLLWFLIVNLFILEVFLKEVEKFRDNNKAGVVKWNSRLLKFILCSSNRLITFFFSFTAQYLSPDCDTNYEASGRQKTRSDFKDFNLATKFPEQIGKRNKDYK